MTMTVNEWETLLILTVEECERLEYQRRDYTAREMRKLVAKVQERLDGAKEGRCIS